MYRRAVLATVGSSMSVALAGCSDLREPDQNVFHLELINSEDESVTFNVLIEQENNIIVWKSFSVKNKTNSGPLGQRIPDLGIEERLDGPVEIRVQADGQYTEVLLESDQTEWTSDRTAANYHISVWKRDHNVYAHTG